MSIESASSVVWYIDVSYEMVTRRSWKNMMNKSRQHKWNLELDGLWAKEVEVLNNSILA